jgi:hypothetical protein
VERIKQSTVVMMIVTEQQHISLTIYVVGTIHIPRL